MFYRKKRTSLHIIPNEYFKRQTYLYTYQYYIHKEKKKNKKKIELDRQEKEEIDWNVCTSRVNNGYKEKKNIYQRFTILTRTVSFENESHVNDKDHHLHHHLYHH